MSGIVWLASYPKSGNTWVRIFLDNYMLDGDSPADINDLDEGLHAGSRVLFDRLTGVESSDLTAAEIDRARPSMYGQWAAESDAPLFVKVHDAWRCNEQGEPLFPASATALVVYIVRNPLDIVASFANHYAMSHDRAIAAMADGQYALATSGRKLNGQLRQLVGSWDEHVCSWLSRSGLPAHVVRYEELCRAPRDTFGALLQAVGLQVDEQRLAKAIDFSSFERLKDQEVNTGFKERIAGSGPFFRRGRAGSWIDELTAAQIARVVEKQGTIMRHFGYL